MWNSQVIAAKTLTLKKVSPCKNKIEWFQYFSQRLDGQLELTSTSNEWKQTAYDYLVIKYLGSAGISQLTSRLNIALAKAPTKYNFAPNNWINKGMVSC